MWRMDMPEEELGLLEKWVGPDSHVWEWGSGASTFWFAKRARRVTSVEHQPTWARTMIEKVTDEQVDNVALLVVPPDLPYDQNVVRHDGTAEEFASYCGTFTGERVGLVLIDGRARVACAQRIVAMSKAVSLAGVPIFLHDCQRPEYAPIWTEILRPRERQGLLLRLEVRDP